MKTELVPRYVGDILPFSVATCDHLEKPGLGEVSETTYGQVFKDGLLAWLANGSSLEVVSTRNGERHGTWEFGIEHPVNGSIRITCVTEIKESRGSRIVVGTDNGVNGGFICILNIYTSKIAKVIAVPQKVTSIEMISPMGGVNPYNFLLCQELRYMYGILSVGMQDGSIYLVDLMLDDFSYSDELNPSELAFFTKQTHNIPNKREDALARGEHLTLHLNDGCQSRDRFQFRTPENDVSNSLLVDDVFVSALLYARPNGCLIAGFSFGGFQIWNLNKLQLVHTSHYRLNCPPIIKLTFQEPDNDPRNFCYIWVVWGQPMNENKQDELTTAALYSLSFEQKVHTEGFGQCYQELISCIPRFDFELNHDPMQVLCGDTVASRLISCMTIEEMASRYQSEHQPHANMSMREEGTGCSLCLFVWESIFIDPNVRPRATLAIFDLNQWYQAQMPSKLKCASIKLCPYFGFYSLCSITEKGMPDFLLDVYIPSQSIRRMQTNSRAEQFFYPSSLAFDAVSLFDTGVIHAPFLGLQRQVMLELKKIGPSFLVNPNDAFQICMCSSLLPLHGEQQTSNLSLNGQRESLLSMALEYEMIDFVISCITEWASGQCTIEGCTLRFIQDWAWKRVYHIKTLLDKQCISLFDCSGVHLDTLTVQSLCHQVGQLKNLELVFRALLNQCQAVPTTDHGAKELEHRGNVISLLVLYLEVILWFLNYGLLPENDEVDDCGSSGIAYPCNLLSRIYSKRRAEIQRLSSTVGPKDLLFIDGLLAHMDDSLSSLWERNGGDGLYPPPSLHSLLNSYLLPNISSTVKHQIVQYLFLDLAELLDSEHYANIVEKLVKFPSAFSLSPSCIKLTQGFWLLDHKVFEEAISMLLHPMVNATDICPWQHSRVMKAFLYQGEPKKALTYARVRRPSLQTAEDVRFHLTLLLANGLVAEAYHYQKSVRNQGNAENLLQHFFLGCQQTKNFRDLLNLPLSPLEENHLVDFLNNCQEPQAREILVIYYLQRSRYVDAMRLNERLIPRVMHEADPAARERAITRNAIVDGFSKLLPHVYGQITQSAKHLFGPGKNIWLQVPRPQPLSTKVIAYSKEPMSQSDLIETVMGQITSVWSMPPEDYSPIRKSSIKIDHRLNVVPLIGTPVSTKKSLENEEDHLTQPVFPTIVGRDAGGLDQSLYHISPAKKARFLDVSPAHLSPSGRRRSLSYYNAEALSLLQTPPVRRKTPSSKSSAVKISTSGFTPQSILKVHLKDKPLTSTSESIHEKAILPLAITPDIVEEQVTPSSSPEYKQAQDKFESRHLRFQFSSSNEESHTSSMEISFVEESSVNAVKDFPVNTNLPVSDGVAEEPHASPRRPLYSKQSTSASDNNLLELNDNSPTSVKEVVSMSSNSSQSTEELNLGEDNRMNFDDEEDDVDSVSSVAHQRDNESNSDISTDENPASIPSLGSPSKSQVSAVLQMYSEGVDLIVQDASSDSSTSEEVNRLNKERPREHALTPLTHPSPTSSVKTPSPRSMSFFSAERGKEHFMQMKYAMSKELAKQSGETNFDFKNADLEIVETESPLASLVNKTLDSVFSTRSDLPSILSNKLTRSSTDAFCTSKTTSTPCALNDNRLLIPLIVDVHDIECANAQTASPSIVSQISPRTRSQTAREKEALQLGSPSIRRSPRKSSSLSPKLANTSPSALSCSKLGKKSPDKAAESPKSKISITPKKSSTFGRTKSTQKDVVSFEKLQKSPSLSPKSVTISSPIYSDLKSATLPLHEAEMPKTASLESAKIRDAMLPTEGAELVDSSNLTSRKPVSPKHVSKSSSPVLQVTSSQEKTLSPSCSLRSQNQSENSGKDIEYHRSKPSYPQTLPTTVVEMAETDVVTTPKKKLMPVLQTQSSQDVNLTQTVTLKSPSVSQSSPTLSSAARQRITHGDASENMNIPVVSCLHFTPPEASLQSSSMLEMNKSNEEFIEMQVSGDSMPESKKLLPVVSPNAPLEMLTEDTLTSLPVHLSTNQEGDDQEMTPALEEIESTEERRELRTPELQIVAHNLPESPPQLSHLVHKYSTCDQNTSTSTLNYQMREFVLENESEVTSAEAKADKNTSTTTLYLQTPNVKQKQKDETECTEIHTESLSIRQTSPRTRSQSGLAVSSQDLKKSPKERKPLATDHMENKPEHEVSTPVNIPFTIRTRSKSGQKSYNLRVRMSPKKEMQKEIPMKVNDDEQVSKVLITPLSKGSLLKDLPAGSEKVRLARCASQTMVSHSTTTEVDLHEKSFKPQNSMQLSNVISERIEQTDMIVEEDVSDNHDKGVLMSTGLEPHSEIGAETPAMTQKKSRKTPRRKAIKTTFIGEDERVKTPTLVQKKPGQKPRFSFSHPTIIDTEEADYTLLQTPPSFMASYIFSPPLTRSKSRKPRRTPEEVFSGDSNEPASGTSLSSIEAPTTPRVSMRRKSSSQSFSDTPINFISPVLESSEPGDDNRNVAHSLRSSSVLHRHSMTLRKQKGFLVTRKSARLD